MRSDPNECASSAQIEAEHYGSRSLSRRAIGASNVLWVATIAVVTVSVTHYRPWLLAVAGSLFILSFLPVLMSVRRSAAEPIRVRTGARHRDDDS